MPKPNIRNLDRIRAGNYTGAHLHEAFQDIVTALSNMSDQGNLNPSGIVAKPPQVTSVNVSASNGQHHVTIFDDNPVRRGIFYHFEASTTPNFAAGTVYGVQSGPSRTHIGFYGNTPLYWRAYSQYLGSAPSTPVYFGSETGPTPANGGGSVGGPSLLPGTGSGTELSSQSQGGQGFGGSANRTLPRD